MKTILLSLALAGLLLSGCYKDGRIPKPTPATNIASVFFQFRANHMQYQTFAAKEGSSTTGVKIMTSNNGNYLKAWLNEKFSVLLPMPNTLEPGTFHFDKNSIVSSGEIKTLEVSYGLKENTDTYIITITRVSNGTVDGIFSASNLSLLSGDMKAPKTIILSNGIFEGVKVF